MKTLCALLLLAAPAAAQFNFPPVQNTQFEVAGTVQSGVAFVNFSTGLAGSNSNGVLTITTTGGVPVPSTRTLTTTAPLTCDAGTSCDLSANRTLAITDLSIPSDTFTITSAKAAGASNIGVNVNCTNSPGHCLSVAQNSVEKVWLNSVGINFADGLGINNAAGAAYAYWGSGAIANQWAWHATVIWDQARTFDLGGNGSANGPRRFYLEGTATVANDFALSAGWGTTASVGTITGSDPHAQFTVTSAGTGQGANPTITYTFHDGTWTSAPFCSVNRTSVGTAADVTTQTTWTTSATQIVITWNGTPTATRTYTFNFRCDGGA